MKTHTLSFVEPQDLDKLFVAEWKPIGTAPKDGTYVLLFSPDSSGGPFIGQWRDRANYPDGGAWWPEYNESGFAIDADPSHWMPLPPPPTQ